MSTNYFFRALAWRTTEHTFFKPLSAVENGVSNFKFFLSKPVQIKLLQRSYVTTSGSALANLTAQSRYFNNETRPRLLRAVQTQIKKK